MLEGATPYRFEIGDLGILWQDWQRGLLVQLEGVRVRGDDGAEYARIDDVAVGFSAAALAHVVIAPSSIEAHGVAITLPPALARLRRFAARVAVEIGDGRPAPVTVDLMLEVDGEPWHLTGSIDLLPGQRLLRYRFGPRSPRDRLDLVSHRYTGDPLGGWRIAEANAALDPDRLVGDEAVGTDLDIPTPGIGGV